MFIIESGNTVTFGYYDDDENVITLNESKLNADYSYYMFSVIRHEVFHTYQQRCIRGELQTESQVVINLWREAAANYVEDRNNGKYEENALEVYARAFQ